MKKTKWINTRYAIPFRNKEIKRIAAKITKQIMIGSKIKSDFNGLQGRLNHGNT